MTDWNSTPTVLEVTGGTCELQVLLRSHSVRPDPEVGEQFHGFVEHYLRVHTLPSIGMIARMQRNGEGKIEDRVNWLCGDVSVGYRLTFELTRELEKDQISEILKGAFQRIQAQVSTWNFGVVEAEAPEPPRESFSSRHPLLCAVAQLVEEIIWW